MQYRFTTASVVFSSQATPAATVGNPASQFITLSDTAFSVQTNRATASAKYGIDALK